MRPTIFSRGYTLAHNSVSRVHWDPKCQTRYNCTKVEKEHDHNLKAVLQSPVHFLVQTDYVIRERSGRREVRMLVVLGRCRPRAEALDVNLGPTGRDQLLARVDATQAQDLVVPHSPASSSLTWQPYGHECPSHRDTLLINFCDSV